jgi:hypothetical protein
VSYESSAQPIKIGYLIDFLLPEGFPKTYFEDLTQPFDLVFNKGIEQGLIDRPIDIIYREVEGLPRDRSKRSSTPTVNFATRDAWPSSVRTSPTTRFPSRRRSRSVSKFPASV